MGIDKILPPRNKFFLKVALLLVVISAFFAPIQARTLTVCSSGCNYTSIQYAIDNANPGDTVEVYSGTYYEHVVVYKQITLLGINTGGGRPVVDASGFGIAITITADEVTLEGFEVRNSGNNLGEAGIKVTSDNNIIRNNNVNHNDQYGIYLDSSDNNTITNNTASRNHYGIYLDEHSKYNTITNNTATNNYYGILLDSSSNNIIYNNNASYNNRYGIYLIDSSRYNTIYNNIVNSNIGDGIHLEYYANNNAIYNNSVSNNLNGILLDSSSNNIIYNNNASYNNRYGIYLDSSDNNIIHLNNFINNANSNVYSYDSINIWNTTEKVTYTYKGNQYTNYLGNYWSDYTGTDSDGDGIGDSAYILYGINDRYPLVERFENYTLSEPIPVPTPTPTPTPTTTTPAPTTTLTPTPTPTPDPWSYDENNNNVIEHDEAVKAVQDYFNGRITRDLTLEVVKLYFG